MISEPMKLVINQYRAIDTAEIQLNGLTVVSGINGCGKSIISKMLHSVFEISNDFYPIVRLNNLERLEEYYKLLSYIVQGIRMHYYFEGLTENKNKSYLAQFDKLEEDLTIIKLNNKFAKEDINEIIEKIKKLIDEVVELHLDNKEISISSFSIMHIISHQKEEFGFTNKNANEISEIQEFFEFVKNDIEKIINKIYEEAFVTRPKKYLLDRLPLLFHTNEQPTLLELYEKGTTIIDKERGSISNPYFIKNVVYLDTPMAFQSSSTVREHWNKLNQLLVKKMSSEQLLPEGNKKICDMILKILGGDIDINSNNRIIFSKKNDSLKLDLIDCATGVQSLSILYALLNNNSINDNTLLILDEPEVHLHPQWITELARVLILIRKYVKCHIFISTHSPDMIRGLRYLAEKEDLLDDLNFFLAKESENHVGKFNYINLENKIGDIFECFNRSFEKLDSMIEEDKA